MTQIVLSPDFAGLVACGCRRTL